MATKRKATREELGDAVRFGINLSGF